MNKKLSRLLQPGLGWYFAAMGLFALLSAVREQYALAAVEAGITLLLLIFYLIRKAARKRELQAFIRSTADVLDEGRSDNPFPMMMVRMGDNEVIWTNDEFEEISGFKENMMEQDITEVLPGFSMDWLVSNKREYPYDLTLGTRRYRVYGNTVRAGETLLALLYFADLTELYQIRDEYIRSRPVVSIILIDNYDELTKSMTEGGISAMNAKLNDTITAWTESYHGMLRKLDRSRFVFVFEKRDLDRAIGEKFSLLEEIHQITNPAGVGASISIGLGVDAATFEEGYEFAALALETALSRGGDQAVIKNRFTYNFYGGRNIETGHVSKTTVRTRAGSLMEHIGSSSHVFIMGHKNADLDAVGAAMGIACMCRKRGKKPHIVLDLEHNAAGRLIEEIVQVPEYQDVFISAETAMLMCDSTSILIVVDTNRPDQVESKPLLESIPKVCVVDHHRRAADYIDPVLVEYHDPAASSAAELTVGLMQFCVDKQDVLPIEAKSLLAGIFLDTKSFNVRTNENTFEAAAFLRRLGADPVEVKKLLQNDFQDTVAKYQIIKSARLYRQEIAIAALNSSTSRTLAAQAADELLNISGISASFVLYPSGDEVIISARSIGDANVQVILEPLGGGGNTATAGAQLKNCDVKDALDRLVKSIDSYYAS